MIWLIREEIVCLLVLVFLSFYYSTNKIKEKGENFSMIIMFAVLHVVFDIITVLIVNEQSGVPDNFIDMMQILFYTTGVLTSWVYYINTIYICALHKQSKMLEILGSIPIPIFILLLFIVPMKYIDGDWIKYSHGPLVVAGYALFLIYSVASLILMIVCKKKLDDRVKLSLIPMTVIINILVALQVVHPETMVTSGCITLMCIGNFVALDNPDKKYREQALWDFLTGIKNKNCYIKDIEMYEVRYSGPNNRRRIGFIVADLNNLKKLNDTHGHIEGDKLISSAAMVLTKSLKTADNIYHVGGDEFIAVYLSPDDGLVELEIENARNISKEVKDLKTPLEIAIGYYSGVANESIKEIIDEADRLMYIDKARLKGLVINEES